MKKLTLPLLFGAVALLSAGTLYAQDAEAAATPAPDSKEAKRAARRAAAIAEVKQLLVDLTAETNKLNDALTAAEQGKEVVPALDAW